MNFYNDGGWNGSMTPGTPININFSLYDVWSEMHTEWNNVLGILQPSRHHIPLIGEQISTLSKFREFPK